MRGRVLGPFDEAKLKVLASRGQLSRMHEVSTNGMVWGPASEYPDLFVGLDSIPNSAGQVRDVPAAPAAKEVAPAPPQERQWWYRKNGVETGPVDESALQQALSSAMLTPDDPIWTEGMPQWLPARQVPGVMRPTQDASWPQQGPTEQEVQTRGPTSYTANSLAPGEKILYAARISPMIFVLPGILFIAGLLVIAIGMCFSAAPPALFFLVLIFALIFALRALITFFTTECVLTDRRLVGKKGFLSNQSLELLLAKVEGFGVGQGIFGRIFDYGTVSVSGTGGSHTRFQGIAKPLELRKHVQQQISAMQG
jgi:hypothetical protein